MLRLLPQAEEDVPLDSDLVLLDAWQCCAHRLGVHYVQWSEEGALAWALDCAC
jgi:hypothetical protein